MINKHLFEQKTGWQNAKKVVYPLMTDVLRRSKINISKFHENNHNRILNTCKLNDL